MYIGGCIFVPFLITFVLLLWLGNFYYRSPHQIWISIQQYRLWWPLTTLPSSLKHRSKLLWRRHIRTTTSLLLMTVLPMIPTKSWKRWLRRTPSSSWSPCHETEGNSLRDRLHSKRPQSLWCSRMLMTIWPQISLK